MGASSQVPVRMTVLHQIVLLHSCTIAVADVLFPDIQQASGELSQVDDVCDGDRCDDSAVWLLQRRGKFVLDHPRAPEVHGPGDTWSNTQIRGINLGSDQPAALPETTSVVHPSPNATAEQEIAATWTSSLSDIADFQLGLEQRNHALNQLHEPEVQDNVGASNKAQDSLAPVDIALPSTLPLGSAAVGAMAAIAELSGQQGSPKLTSTVGPLLGCLQRVAGPLSIVDFLGVVPWRWPAHRSPKWPFTLAGVFATFPAVLAYGLPWLFGGAGSLQLISIAAYWAIVRPAAGALETIWQRHWSFDACHETTSSDAEVFGPAAQRGAAAAASAAAAHFYWTWSLFEIATRRRSLGQRVAGVGGIGALLLPIPLAQVFLGERSLVQAAANAMLGAVLGFVFFLTLHASPLWKALEASNQSVSLKDGLLTWKGFWLTPRDNLTTFWGGSIWPRTKSKRFPMPLPCSVPAVCPHYQYPTDPMCDSGT